tara:strand:+ start:165 stop:347 length:183 start_codon:yes stop_codon:yes gene_type:complete
MALRQNWSKLMRQTIRLEVGGIEKAQVTYQYPDGLGKKKPRSSVFFPTNGHVLTKARLPS